MENNQQLIYENRVSLSEAVKDGFGGFGKFIGGLFRLNPKSAAVVSGGLFLGVLTGLPVIGWGGVLWALLFGAFTVFLYIQRAPQPAQYTDGVVLGAIAGTIGSFIQLVISLVLGVLYLIFAGLSSAARPRQPDPWFGPPSQAFEMLSAFGTAGYMIFSSLAFFVPLILLAMLGGLLGVVWFESRVSDAARISKL
jgi:hypothetical protein